MYYYQRKERYDLKLMDVLRSMAEKHPTYGFRKMFHLLRNQGYDWNHKKVHRVYCALGLNLKRKVKRRLPARVKHPLEVPEKPNQVWSMDFMSHSLYNGRRFRVFNLIDDFNREALWIETDTSIGSKYVIDILDLVIREKGKPLQVRVDNGPEFISSTFINYCNKLNIEIRYIQPGKPMQNAFIERFNGSYRRDVLDAYIFYTLKEVKQITSIWMMEYNTIRPHESLGDIAPEKFAEINTFNPKSTVLN